MADPSPADTGRQPITADGVIDIHTRVNPLHMLRPDARRASAAKRDDFDLPLSGEVKHKILRAYAERLFPVQA